MPLHWTVTTFTPPAKRPYHKVTEILSYLRTTADYRGKQKWQDKHISNSPKETGKCGNSGIHTDPHVSHGKTKYKEITWCTHFLYFKESNNRHGIQEESKESLKEENATVKIRQNTIYTT